LLAFFKQCSREEYNANLARDGEKFVGDDTAEDAQRAAAAVQERRLIQKREKAKDRQRRLRERERQQEITAGVRWPDGTKRKIIAVELTDSGLTKRQKVTTAEDTQPGRALKKQWKDKTRKPSGRKKKNEPRQAKYHNWFMPLSWVLIEQASKVAGWQMSPSMIVQIAKSRNPRVFKGLTWETVKGWIDRTGEKPRWSNATLWRIESGNATGHSLGGTCRVFVSGNTGLGRKTY
jgi:hypothetical protein